ncbi:MAG: spore coat protein [Nitrospiraceae bacterium]|nr:MAG: spore coat protein [Nitrospiraceae bacterium]
MRHDDAEFIPFALPDIDEREISAVTEVLKSGWLSSGPQVQAFEEEFSSFLQGRVHAVCVNSATSGLHLSLAALDIGPGDEVIVPVHTFTATAAAVCHAGATPVFVDVDEASLNIDPAAAEAAITSRTRAIIPVHFAGLSCDMDAILALAAKHGLAVIEDAAHALPATYNGHLVGTLPSSATVFSFYATKTLATGEGGMVVTRDPSLAARLRTLRLHGIDRDVFARYHSPRAGWFYQVVSPGYKCNMPDILAAIGRVQLQKLNEMWASRDRIAKRYSSELAFPMVIPPAMAPHGEIHAWHLYVIRLQEPLGRHRDDIIDTLKCRGIGTSVHFIPLHMHSYWRNTFGLAPDMFPVSTRSYLSSISIPIYSRLSDEQVTRIISAIQQALEQLC